MAAKAATMFLTIPCEQAGFRVMMMYRSPAATFMPRALVFPGGKLDDSDVAWARSTGTASVLSAALRRCAAREVFEETGVPVLPADLGSPDAALPDPGSADVGGSRRACLDSPGDLEALLRGVRSDGAEFSAWGSAGRMPPLARFVTPAFEQRQFDAWFFAGSLGATSLETALAWSDRAGIPTLTAADLWADGDGGDRRAAAGGRSAEASFVVWLSPAEALSLHEAGLGRLPPPQWLCLTELSGGLPVAAPGGGGVLARPGSSEEALLAAQSRAGAVEAAVRGEGDEGACEGGPWMPAMRKQLWLSEGGDMCLLMPGDEAFDEGCGGEDGVTAAALARPGPRPPWLGRGREGHRRRTWVEPRQDACPSDLKRLESLRRVAGAGLAAQAAAAAAREVGSIPFGAVRYRPEVTGWP